MTIAGTWLTMASPKRLGNRRIYLRAKQQTLDAERGRTRRHRLLDKKRAARARSLPPRMITCLLYTSPSPRD